MASKTVPNFNIDNPDRGAIAAQLGLRTPVLQQPAPSAETHPEPLPASDGIQLPAREAKEPLAQLNVRVRMSVQRRLRDYCFRNNVSQSEVIEFLLAQALPQPEDAEQ